MRRGKIGNLNEEKFKYFPSKPTFEDSDKIGSIEKVVKHFRANFVAVQKLPQPTWHRLHLVSMLNVTTHDAPIQIAIDEDKCDFIIVLIDTRHLLAVQGPHERLHRFHCHLHWITVCVGYRWRCFELGERDAGNDVLFDEPF